MPIIETYETKSSPKAIQKSCELKNSERTQVGRVGHQHRLVCCKESMIAIRYYKCPSTPQYLLLTFHLI